MLQGYDIQKLEEQIFALEAEDDISGYLKVSPICVIHVNHFKDFCFFSPTILHLFLRTYQAVFSDSNPFEAHPHYRLYPFVKEVPQLIHRGFPSYTESWLTP